MVPPNIGSGGDNSSLKGGIKVGQLLVKNLDLQTTCNDSLINALQGLNLESELVINPLDLSVSNSVLDLSEGVKEDEWLLSASLTGYCEDVDTLQSQDWLTIHPSQDVCDSDKKKLLVDMLDGIADQGHDDSDRVFSSPTCQLIQPQSSSIKRIMKSHENSPYLLPMPSHCMDSKSKLCEDAAKLDAASSYMESHLHSPTLSDHPLSPTCILSLSPLQGFKVSSAANLTFDSLNSPPTKTGHSPPWPQLVSTPSAKPDYFTKSWHTAGSKLGPFVPPQFEPKMELSPPTGERCLNTTETKVTICVQDTDVKAQLNTTQTMETPMNTTQTMDTVNMTQAKETPVNTTQTIEAPMNTTQTMDNPLNTTQIKETPMNTTQPVVPHGLANTTQTFAEEPCNTTQNLGDLGMNTTQPSDSHINTTQTLDTAPLNTTAEVPHNITQTQTIIGKISPGLTVNSLCNSMGHNRENKSLNTTQSLNDCTPLKNNSSYSLSQVDLELSSVALNQTSTSEIKLSSESQLFPSLTTELTNESNKPTVVYSEDLNSNLEAPTLPSSLVYQAITPVSSNIVMHTHPLNQNQESSQHSPSKEEFIRNSELTGTYRVSPLLDSKGRKLPGPGVKAGSKLVISGQSKQTSEGVRPILQPNHKLTSNPGAKVKSHNLPRSSIRGFNSLEKLKQIPEVQLHKKSTPELKPCEMKQPASKPMEKGDKSENLGKTLVSTSDIVKPQLSIKLKPSSIVPSIKKSSFTHRLSSNDKSNLSQPKNPLPVPPKLPVSNTQGYSQISKLQPTRFQCPPPSCVPGSASGSIQSAHKPVPASINSGIRPPLARCGIRPPSYRPATSGIARPAGRQSLGGSRLPMPGRVG